MSVSIFVLLGVEHIRTQTKQSFNSTVSGVDLIVGAKTGSEFIALFRFVLVHTNNIDWQPIKPARTTPRWHGQFLSHWVTPTRAIG